MMVWVPYVPLDGGSNIWPDWAVAALIAIGIGVAAICGYAVVAWRRL